MPEAGDTTFSAAMRYVCPLTATWIAPVADATLSALPFGFPALLT